MFYWHEWLWAERPLRSRDSEGWMTQTQRANKSELTIKTAWCWQEFSERMNSISEFSLSLGNLLKYGTLSYKCNLKSFHYLLTWTYFYNIIHSKVIQSMPILWRFISYPHKIFPNHVMVTDTFVNWMNTAVNSLFRKKMNADL